MDTECVNVGTKVSAAVVGYSCVYWTANPLLIPTPTSYWHSSFPTDLSLSLFSPSLPSHIPSLSYSLSPHPAGGSEGSAEEESSWVVGHQWLTLSNLSQSQWTLQDLSKGARIQQCHSQALACSTTLKIIIYFTEIVRSTVADCEWSTLLLTFPCWKNTSPLFSLKCFCAVSKSSLKSTNLPQKKKV